MGEPKGPGSGNHGSGGNRGGDAEPTAPGRSPSSTQVPARTSSSTQVPARTISSAVTAVAPRPPPGANRRQSATGIPAIDLGNSRSPQEFKKHIERSAFHVDDSQFGRALEGHLHPGAQDDDDEATELGVVYDGETPAKAVTGRDLFARIHAPVQSREGRRSERLYTNVINQFAVATNPRYEPDGERLRAHIFLWDVTRAMNAEIPHFLGTREQSIGQTYDWVRNEAPSRGWRGVDATGALAAANEGCPVLCYARDAAVHVVGIVRSGELGTDGRPRIAAAGRVRGNDLTPQQALGASNVLYLVHA